MPVPRANLTRRALGGFFCGVRRLYAGIIALMLTYFFVGEICGFAPRTF
jgi:hypothetical protein